MAIQMTTKELDARIHSFLKRKAETYPEMDLLNEHSDQADARGETATSFKSKLPKGKAKELLNLSV